MFKRYATTIGACLAVAALLAGCGDEGSSLQLSDEGTVVSPSSEVTREPSTPEQVLVCQPGMVDTALTVDDVPEWPGPPPAEFIDPEFPGGPCGILAGPEAKDVYEAAVENPAALLKEGRLEASESLSDTSDALWSRAGVIAWLVVEPRW